MMDFPKIGNGLPVIGPGTDIGISSLHMVGYLGKNYDSAKAPSDGYCPACREKGKLKALKTYRISFQESIFLCEDLQCIYPLGSKSLNNLISPDLEDCHTPNKPQKRKFLETKCKDASLLANAKKTKSHIVTVGEQVLNSKDNGEAYDKTSSHLPDLPQTGPQNPVRTADSLEQTEILEADTIDLAAEGYPSTVDVSGTGGISPQNEGCMSELEMPLESKCTSLCQSLCVQWKNANALCWLDCILSALVHLEGLKNTATDLCPNEDSVFWQLFTKYNQANKLLHTNQLDGIKDGDCEKLTSEIFAKIEACLNEVRDEIFIRLQPQLRCTLGDMESPVFALPLLLKMEPLIEKLFMYSFSWNFDCSQCGHKYQNRYMKNLVTFTNVIPEWHPLNAAHFGPCNNCSNKSQIRKMILEKVSPVFMLHFVEGLPRNDLQHYSFHFEGCLYQITSVIQYQANNHFITWVLDPDGSWLECDDLKGLRSERREKFEVLGSEIHIVIWERKTSQMTDKASACLPLKKSNDEPAFSDEKPASPTSCSVGDTATAGPSSRTLPTDVAIAPSSLSQGEAVACGHHLFSGPEDLVDSDILSLTLEEIQINSEHFLNEHVAENAGVCKTNTSQSQESRVASLLSAPCVEKLTQDQVMDLSFPSQIVDANMQLAQMNTKDVITKPVNSTHATDPPIHGIKPIEVEGTVALEDTPLKQFLSPKTEKLKPEQPVTTQVSNLMKNETATFSQSMIMKPVQNPTLKETQKKPFVGSWVKGLLSKGASFMPPCVSAHNRNTVTDLQPSVKGASNFGGFKTKGVNQKANRASRKVNRCASKPPTVSNSLSSRPSSGSMTSHVCAANVIADSDVLKKCENASYGAHRSHDSYIKENGISSANHEDSVEGQIHKLRLKLLKKLKAKKKKLAALMSSPKKGTLPSEKLEHVSHCGSRNNCESIEDLLKELQYQIDTADNKSGCTRFPYSSQSHEEILAELLSPATVVSTEHSENGEADFRYLEMGDDNVPAPVSTELNNIPQNTHLKQDHNYCSPTKKNQCEVQPDSLTTNVCIRALNLESSMKTDIFDEFFSTSALNSLANDTDLPHFDEYLFESC
ncbi:SUMO-specific isopeptidase USPL1 isoform X1 [Canis lupus familiaris]|uniref:Ubiquitin specific peptidase like 1 n=5 Tax=Canis lupus TaxID=9612 RepID=A0A8C0Z053_CANLF|nr:SUMO-specific isopeptidase USPL1 isoform X1 [Canis lupus dingo]XP_025318366.1 SUMO-specific isopeptidase USPL1 isoform X1 [Canis lupus dingo]XP_035575821.1 SUMO-specific isopeptidase USPL1 isoform X1 [Canis lupus dingo]XP_038290857.1 SUMO-specific isopeptidase USPL1 isoform X1 [Canis lupus familiaris]XP_038290858.1 SUMO-specific isopeptidase USPL1 isoform X1 [Canis lupus familiaris]XP_038290859.1 SUMO-specific isopeptidase USPL1 isoform X1 [Canis lupus familiaris]XP_038314551.1 SUMO-specif|eukprot:XP_543145.2 SUMO-specific isopeptidase USPL1 isoform X1 [Canis lupus familiaris]